MQNFWKYFRELFSWNKSIAGVVEWFARVNILGIIGTCIVAFIIFFVWVSEIIDPLFFLLAVFGAALIYGIVKLIMATSQYLKIHKK